MAPKIGQTYKLRHVRFGNATVRVAAIDGEWIELVIVRGILRSLLDEWGPGERKTVRDCHCTFTR